MTTNEMFERLDSEEVKGFKKWARDNYKVGSPVNPVWHPVVRLECEQMNVEAVQSTKNNNFRPLHVIAADIKKSWKNVWYGAIPYLRAMYELDSIDDMFFEDSARDIVCRFLGNASYWRGEDARRIKAELNEMLKS